MPAKIYEYKDPRTGLYTKTDFKEGDKLVRITTSSSSSSEIQRGDIVEVTHVDVSYANSSDYVPVRTSSGTVRKEYVYEQKLYVSKNGVPFSRAMNGSNFAKVNQMSSTLQIETNRPTFVREFTETTKDGKVVREYVGDWVAFDNMSAAQTYCSEQITKSIREVNTYRQFSIVQEKAVARAKKPEIEFA